jgi:hypothetical protein
MWYSNQDRVQKNEISCFDSRGRQDNLLLCNATTPAAGPQHEFFSVFTGVNTVGVMNSRRMRWAGYVARMGEGRVLHRDLVGKPEWKRPLGKPRNSGKIILRWIFRNWEVGEWNESSWLRIGTGDGHLWMRWGTFGFRKTRGNSWLAENVLAPQEGLCSLEWVSEWVSRIYRGTGEWKVPSQCHCYLCHHGDHKEKFMLS